jgi:transposase
MAQPCPRHRRCGPRLVAGCIPLPGKPIHRRMTVARAFVETVTAVGQEATLSRLQLRPDRYRQLDAKQQKQYLEMVQSRAAELT